MSEKIVAIETLRTREFANVLWARVHTHEGTIGLGETFYDAPIAAGAPLREALYRASSLVQWHERDVTGLGERVRSSAQS